MSYAELLSIREQGIKAIMNLSQELEELVDIEQQEGFEVYYLPIADEKAPAQEELEEALDWLDEAIYLQRKVLIHCRHGIGRTGTVVLSFLLRKGFGRKMAQKKLRTFRSKPVNYRQYRFVQDYGKEQGQLSLREPLLDPKFAIDLHPFFQDLEDFFGYIDQLFPEDLPVCGREHDRCCWQEVRLSLIEAVYIHHMMNITLDSSTRRQCIEQSSRLLESLTNGQEKENGRQGTESPSWQKLCILNKDQQCLLFSSRPVACRLTDIKNLELNESEWLENELRRLSNNLFFAFAGTFCHDHELEFSLPEVISGKYVHRFFHALAKIERKN
jgi:protein tyrosine phosphatase (PTP) superfamily phosphohydrolase (DUF442 family)